jgi:MoaA/NifB/PqqE/SkfB family radical SAM enzyme
MTILNRDNINQLQIDITSYCNAFCPGCARNINGGEINPILPLQHMSISVWEKIVNFVKTSNIKILQFNGNYGDAANHPKIIEMFELLSEEVSEVDIIIHTNGGARNAKFWHDLAEVLKKFSNYSHVVFSIDGLRDTNHIHRRGVDYDTLIDNVESFIRAGGSAMWRMIVFEHNKHNVPNIHKYANELGFKVFYLNRSYATKLEMMEYKNLPAGVVYKIPNEEFTQLKKQYGFWNLHRTEAEPLNNPCPWQQERRVQITIDGSVHPCCYYALFISDFPQMHGVNEWNEQSDPMSIAYKNYGNTFNNLNYFTLDEIINHNFWSDDLPKFWSTKDSICSHQCDVC